MEKFNIAKIIISLARITEEFNNCDIFGQEAIIFSLLSVMKETDRKRWKRIIENTLTKDDTDIFENIS